MARWIRARWVHAAALLLIAAFAGAFVEDLAHTDDGCKVEIHCLACKRVLVSVGIAALPAPWAPLTELVGRIVTADLTPAYSPEAPPAGSRAPPLA